MPFGFIEFSRKLILVCLVSWSSLGAAAEVGSAEAQRHGGTDPAKGDVQFADGSSIPPQLNPTVQVVMPTLAPKRTAKQDDLTPLESAPVPLQTQVAEPVSPSSAKPIGSSAEPASIVPTEKTPKSVKDKEGAKGPLVPVPESKYAGPADIEVTSFHGITPGVSTREAVEKTWGKPKESKQQDNKLMQLYSVDPFPRVEVAYAGDKVASLIIRFERGFPSGQVAEQLDLTKVQPVLVSNELGEVLGQAYPERGVLFSFEPAADPTKALKKVTHIILEPISAEPFVLRAETNIDTRPEFSLHDAQEAVKLQPANARAHWLRCRALGSLGRYDSAVAAAVEAVRLDPKDARFQVTKAEAMLESGHIVDAIPEAEKAVQMAEQRPHVKARALCMLGDLKGAGSRPDFKKALQYHTEALQLAATMISSKHPAIRVAAKEVVLDAHLGALHDVAWGAWREKERSAENWLSKASDLAQDLVRTEEGSEEYLFRVSTHALTSCVGLQGKFDPTRWAKEAVQAGDTMIAAAPEPARKAQIQWELSVALYDAMQVFQMRGDSEAALKNGELAISYLEKSGRSAQIASAAYLLGRIHFRTGAIHAIHQKDHTLAVKSFEKAVPLLGKTPPPDAMADLARLGDSFVSMGVSYWNVGMKKKAIALTQHGTNLIEEAVRRGVADRKVLSVPYTNLAAMSRSMGDNTAAIELEAKANSSKLR